MIEILTAALVGATIVLAYYTYLMQSETKKSRMDNAHGLVVITAEQNEYQQTHLVIKNIGAGPAFDIKLVAEIDLTYFDGRSLERLTTKE